MGKQEGRERMPMISNLSKYNWTVPHTVNDHIHFCLQCLHVEITSENPSPRSGGAAMI